MAAGDYDRSVFVNCPFDAEFQPIRDAIVFSIIDCGFIARCALESANSGEVRIEKIAKIIRDCRFGVHDISRTELSANTGLPRFNMPFELGLDFGCRLFGSDLRKGKRCLVLEAEPYRYKAALSDLSGSDIESHGNEPYRVVAIVRNWLKNVCPMKAAGPAKIEGAFTDFMAQNYDNLTAKGFSPRDIEALPVPELIECMEDWIAANT